MEERDQEIEMLQEKQSRDMDALCESDASTVMDEGDSLFTAGASRSISAVVSEHM